MKIPLLLTVGLAFVASVIYAQESGGRMESDLLGGYDLYDQGGNKIGHADSDLLGGYDLYDQNGNKRGHAESDLLGGYDLYSH